MGSHEMTGGPERSVRWHYWRVDADGDAYGPRRSVSFPQPVELADAAQLAAETEHDIVFGADRLRDIGGRAEAADGAGQTFEFETAKGPKRVRVVCRVRLTYDDVREL